MRSKTFDSVLVQSGLAAFALLFGSGTVFAQQQVNLTAAPDVAPLPDGSTVHMWGYSCGAAPSGGSLAACARLSPAAGGWSPVIITIPSGQSLQINLTNSLSFGANKIPTSLVIVGQLGGGLGTLGIGCTGGTTCTDSPDHTNAQQVTWPIADPTTTATPPAQGKRAQSFGTEVPAGTTASLCWGAACPIPTPPLRPGTYLLESGTHPSIQGPMGLYGMVVVTTAPTTTPSVASGTAYPGIQYDADVPLLLSEIDPVQNNAVDTAVNTTGFSETMVWSGQPGGCGNPSSSTFNQCYPPAVNYSPLYYLFNGVPFDKTHASSSLFPNPSPSVTATTGQVLVRFVNAGLRMHVPSIVGAQNAAGSSGFQLIAEDGNPLPGVHAVQSEVFLAAGKTFDVMINAPAANAAALPVFDRQLSLSGNATLRDAGMLAYIGFGTNANAVPGAAAFAAAQANPDTYNSVVPGQNLIVTDPAKGVIANDFNVYGVAVSVAPTQGTVTLNRDGTFTYVPNSGWTSTDSFQYCGNNGAACTSVTLNAAPVELGSGIVMGTSSFTSNTAAYMSVASPGVLAVDRDGSGYALSIAPGSYVFGSGPGTLTVNLDKTGGFTATATAPGMYTFTYKAQNSQGTVSQDTGSVNLTFLAGSGLKVSVVDGKDKSTPIHDYRWIIEEDRTFYVDPTKTTTTGNTNANCATNPTACNVPPTFGTNFHTSYMPVVATGCFSDDPTQTQIVSCEYGQTVLGNNAVCDEGDGGCRTDQQQQTPVDPASVHLDPTKRYYISILPGDAGNPFNNGGGAAIAANDTQPPYRQFDLNKDCTPGDPTGNPCGHGMGGASIAAGQTNVTVLVQPTPFPTAKLSVFVFEDDFPLNGEHDAGGGVDILAPNEPGLGSFNITLFDDAGGTGDATGQMTYDMFNQPLSNSLAGTIDPATGLDACPISKNSRIGTIPNPPDSTTSTVPDPTQTGITGTIVTCPRFESNGRTLSPLAGQAVIANLMPGRYGVVATPGADRIGRGEEWLQTNTLDGQKAHDSFLRIGEPSFFQEFGPAGYHVAIGFANPKIIQSRHDAVCRPGGDGFVLATQCSNTVNGKVTTERMSRSPDERLFSSGSNDSFAFTQCYVSLGDPDSEDFEFTKCNSDGTFTLTNVPSGNWRITVFDQWNDMLVDGLSTPVGVPSGGQQTVNLGDIAMNQWQANIYTSTFFDQNNNGVRDGTEPGLTLVATNIRFRDGSFSNFNNTDLAGNAGFNEVFPLFSWYVVETDSTRYKSTGTHVVYDAGGPADGSAGCDPAASPCGTAQNFLNMANTYEANPVPGALHVPGAVYCDNADCSGQSIADGPNTGSTPHSTGRIDPPWVASEGWQGFSGQNSFLEFGKKPFAPGETGGIRGHVVYASTRPFDDPALLLQLSWEPLVPNVTINLYEEGTAEDGSQSLHLVDTTTTSSWDAWAQGFRSDHVPNMNCPGQSTSDLFYFTLFNQPMYLDVYNSQHGGPQPTPVANNSQYKCYDGMHNWNQLQPAPYDGMYSFPSVTGLDPTTGKPLASNCHMATAGEPWGCVPNPSSTVASDPNYDPYRAGAPMLPPGKYVVEVIVPPGYELVKEEDKNILIGDNYIAPVTVQFPGLGGAIYIMPDQAAVGATYNANNAQNPTTDLGAFPRHEGDTGSVESFWPCVGRARVVPDYISLFPQSGEVSPFAGATRNLCDRKEVTLTEQSSVLAKFYVFTSTHAAAHFTGVITDDFTSEFDPFSPQFGEKFSPPNAPVSIKDWSGTEISRVYSDQWGAYNGLTYSTWEVNPPNPTGYAPTMMVTCMNDPGTGATPDPLYNPQYSQFCYEIPFMPGQTQYMDTPIVPTSAFANAGYNNPDCDYPNATPAVKQVNGDGIGPWVGVGNGGIESVSLTNGGSGYTSVPTVGFTGGGTGAAATATLDVHALTVTNSGNGYTSLPAVTFTNAAGDASGGGATAVVNDLKLVLIANATCVNNSSTNPNRCQLFLASPPVSFTGGGGAGAAATAVKNNCTPTTCTIAFTVTTAGSGYTSRPTVRVTRTNNTTLLLPTNARMGVNTITVTNGGERYSKPPSVTIAAPAGFGNPRATASATMSVDAVVLTANGSGYTSPTVTFTNGGGSGAAATAAANSSPETLQILALGDQTVFNNGYSGPAASAPPFNQKTVTRHYGFGNTKGTVTIGGIVVPPASISTWSDTEIDLTVPAGVPLCTVQQDAHYGGSPARCGQLIVTAANGKQSIDTVTVTIGGKAPTHVTNGNSIQSAINAAAPGDLIMVDPGTYRELLLMWKPVRLQGVGAASSVIDANPHPAGKLDPWRAAVNCLFGLALNGQPNNSGQAIVFADGSPTIRTNTFDATGAQHCAPGSAPDGWNYFTGGPNNPQVDRIPLEGIVGWDTTLNGNLAELLQEPTLMGAYEGAGITVLAKGVRYPGGTNIFGVAPDTDANATVGSEGQMPLGTLPLTNGSADCSDYPSNFLCNPSRIDGLSITNSSQGGGGVYVHGWGHDLEIANNRVYNNTGTLTGGITVGQGESPDAWIAGNAGDPIDLDQQPWSCVAGAVVNGVQVANPPGFFPNQQLPFCFDTNVNVHNNYITRNSSIGDELFSATPAGAGGVTFCTGADYYKFNYNWLCGNLSSGDGGGFAHLGLIFDGDIEHNTILFNESTNPTIPTYGGGIVVMGAAPDGTPPGAAPGTECGSVTDVDCAPGLSDGSGPGLVINGNLIMGNGADSGSGGGIRLQSVNGTEVGFFRFLPALWNSVQVTNNIIANNVAGWDGAGISLQDALVVNIVNNTIVSNDTTASAGVLFNTLGAPEASAPGDPHQSTSPTASAPQAAGIATMQNSSLLSASLAGAFPPVLCPLGHGTPVLNGSCRNYSIPLVYNDVIWQNRAFRIGVGGLGGGTLNQQHVVALYEAFTGNPGVLAPSQPTSGAPVANGGAGAQLITGGTGACIPAATTATGAPNFWDIGVRGDAGPTNHTLIGFTPTSSILSVASVPSVGGSHNSNANPRAVSQYCNGSRIPPEFQSMGYQVPPGISDATVPNPVFNLTPAATVDEGNNWINISWGPLAETNPVTGGLLGDYELAFGSPAIDYVTLLNSPASYLAAPSTDFFGNPRKRGANTAVDAGAVDFTRLAIYPSAGSRPSTGSTSVEVILTASNGTTFSGTPVVSVSGSGVTVSGTTLVNPTTIEATFTIASGIATTTTDRTVTVSGVPGVSTNFKVN